MTAVSIVCPACHGELVIHEIVTTCPRCAAGLPAPIRRDVELGVLLEEAPKPVVLKLVQHLAGWTGVTMLSAAAAIYAAYGMQPDGWLLLTTGTALAAISFGLAREKRWARPLMASLPPALLAALAALGGGAVAMILGTIFIGVPGAVAAVYLYRAPGVRRYYRLLELEEDDDVS